MRERPRTDGIVDPTAATEFATERNDDREVQGPEADTHTFALAAEERPRQFLSAAVAIRQALADLPDVAELARNVQMEETEEGLNICIVDHDGRSMFAENSAVPNESLARILGAIAPVLASLPNRTRISGPTSAGRPDSVVGVGEWSLSTARAMAAAERLAAAGLDPDHFEAVVAAAPPTRCSLMILSCRRTAASRSC